MEQTQRILYAPSLSQKENAYILIVFQIKQSCVFIPFNTPICLIKIKRIYIINNYQTFVKCLTIVFFSYFLRLLSSIYRFLVVSAVLFIFNYVFLKKYGPEIFLETKQNIPFSQRGCRRISGSMM